jgi:predicted TIM-barrel fold metal-dependent hydrolase
MLRIHPSRRELLGGIAAAALAVRLPCAGAADKPGDAGRFDFHHHFFAPKLAKKLAETAPTPGPFLEWKPAKSIEAMDKGGVATTFLSGPAWSDEKDEAVRMARVTNDYGRKLVSDHKGRFGLFATLPLPHIDESLKEIEYSLETLKADGIFLWTNYGNRWLGDKAFDKVLAELNRRKAVVYTHPFDAPCCMNLQPDTPPMMVEYNTNTSRAIWSVINDGGSAGKSYPSVATRYPDISFIWSHAGGTLLGLAGRFVGYELMLEAEGKKPEKDSRLYHLRRFYYDTASSYNRIQMPALKALVGVPQIVFGSDFPFGQPAWAVKGLSSCGFTADELRAIDRDNAVKLLPKWSPVKK